MPRALRDALARHVRGTTGKTVPGDPPGRTQDTGDRADRTAVRGRAKAQGIEVKHRRRVPAEPLVECKAATGQQNPGHPSLPGYAVSRSCLLSKLSARISMRETEYLPMLCRPCRRLSRGLSHCSSRKSIADSVRTRPSSTSLTAMVQIVQ